MNVAEYLQRRCVCGRPRHEHVHVHDQFGGQRVLRVLPLTGQSLCAGYLDEVELELGGNPLDNAHLGPLVREKLDALHQRGSS